MNNIIRVTAGVAKISSGNPLDCAEEIKSLLNEIPVDDSDIIVLPKLALSSPSCGNLFLNAYLLDQCEQALTQLQASTAHLPSYVIVGLPLEDFGKTVSAMAILHKGELIGLIPTLDDQAPLASSGFSNNLLPAETVFAAGSLRFCVLGCSLSTLTLRAAAAGQSGCDLIIAPTYSPVRAGLIDEAEQGIAAISKAVGCAIAVVNGGIGDTSSPYVYQGFISVYECGRPLAHRVAGCDSFAHTIDLDLDIIRAEKKIRTCPAPVYTIPTVTHRGLLREVDSCPWLPKGEEEGYLAELFSLQVRSLTARMENTGIAKLVVGVSGGLDSTAALLVSAAAIDTLGLPRDNLVGITMPGFGTTDRTYYNALSLLETLRVTRRDISIRQAVQLHLEDIGHGGRNDTTYENAQARERAQILLDVANAVSGLVVGTGDLSEEALGFCTFAGDHIANYNVNVCIPKTVLRRLVRYVAEHELLDGVAEVLQDIVDTPVSPELLPPGPDGDTQQKTEEILGPYELHDFFTYYFVHYRMRPDKLYKYACVAFTGVLEPSFIKEKLALFFKKFCAGQFKRACAPDAASITEVNLCSVNHYIPSDMDPTSMLQELELLR